MPTIIDEFIVTLGLDPADYKKEAAALEAEQKKAGQAALKRGREIERSQKRETEAFSKSAKAVTGYLAAFVGVGSITAFLTAVATADADVGRLSRRIGVGVEDISAWQGVLRGAGGSAQDAANDLSILTNAFQDIKLTGTSGFIPFMNLLGISLRDLQDPNNTLLKIADAFSKMDPTTAAALGRQMGFSPAMISTLQRGRGAVRDLLDEQKKLGVATEESTQRAEEMQKSIEALKTSAQNLGRELLGSLAPAITSVFDGLLRWSKSTDFNDSLWRTKQEIHGVVVAFKQAQNFFRGKPLNDGIDTAAEKRGWAQYNSPHPSLGPPVAGGAAPATPTRPTGGGRNPVPPARYDHVVKFFTDRGYSSHAANGIAAGIWAESRGDPGAFNAAGGGQGAYGVGQWRGARLKGLRQRYGAAPTLFQQLEYLEWELRGGNGETAGRSIRGAGSADQALGLYVNGHMRPGADGAVGDMRRGRAMLAQRGGGGSAGGGSTTVTIGSVNVATAATDAPGIARDISGALRQAVPQANLGLN